MMPLYVLSMYNGIRRSHARRIVILPLSHDVYS